MHVGWDEAKWSNVLFTDESTFDIKPTKNNVRCLRKTGERLEFDCMKPTFKSGRRSVNVWGAFSHKGKGPLIRIQGKFNNVKYREIIDSAILPFAQLVHGDLEQFILQKDNCGPHIANAIKQYLQETGVTTMFWPAQSPDINPIENAWALMKQKYRQRTTYAKNEDELFTIISTIWHELPISYFHKLVESMSRRASVLVDRQGRSTKY